jgi:predicted transposase YbfD/YdcC
LYRAAQIVDQGGDYVLALKGNQGRLYEETSHLFAALGQQEFEGVAHDFCETHDEGHGRVETRQCWVINPQDWPERFPTLADWKGLRSLAMIRSERRLDDKVTLETRYFISSLEANAATILNAKRRHWTIENGLHWILDIAFREDQSRIRTDHAPANMAVLRHMALNLLKMETTLKRGIKTKRLKAGWSDAYLLKVLQAGFH